jgi:hypothetical protein
VYREVVDFGAVDSVALWCQNLPPGKEVKCGIGPLTALPMVAGRLKDPAITINGVEAVFVGEMTSGSWLECGGEQDCMFYNANGEVLGKASLSGRLPVLRAGQNQVQFSCSSSKGPSPRVKVTMFTQGEEL